MEKSTNHVVLFEFTVLLDKSKLKKITLSYILHNYPKLFTIHSSACSFFIGNEDMFDKCYAVMKKHYFDDILTTIGGDAIQM